MGWSYNFWKGNFYPKDLNSKDFLSYYSKHFDTVEVDSTFYRIPSTQTLTGWKNQTPANFLFSLKFPQLITHIRMLKNCQEETKVFLERAEMLKEKLGILLLQFPPAFKNEQLPILGEFLRGLPKKHHYAVEVRNKTLLNDKFFSILKENNVAYAWAESQKMPLKEKETSDFLYLRWEGDRKSINGTLGKTEVDKTSNIESWAQKLKLFLSKNIEIFGYFSKYYSGLPPTDAQGLLRSLKAAK
jgi:uncharacterized protein YecE (DUF72 family)